MIYGSVCSGIEAATVAWHPLGWQAAFYSEIEPAPCAVLSHYYPDVPNHGDMTRFKEWPDAALDLLVGGTPCQSFSVAGLRKGLDDPRGNLTLTYLAVTDKYRPRWLVWENVPGVLSDGTGAFGAFLGGLGQLGYGFAYRVLNAQYFGVPQRRRRVFVVGHLGDWRRAAAVLFELYSLQGHPAPSRGAGEGIAADVAPSLRGSGPGASRTGDSRGQDPVIAHAPEIARCVATREGSSQDWETTTMVAQAHVDVMPTMMNGANTPAGHNARSGHSKDNYIVPAIALPLGTRVDRGGSHREAEGNNLIAFAQNSRDELREMPYTGALSAEPGMKQTTYIRNALQVRRLTPRECDRLQGYKDDYTLVPFRGRMMADGPRYKMLGNSMAVPVMRWIGERIAMVEAMPA